MSIVQAWFAAASIRFRTRALRALFRDQRAELFAIWRHLQPGDIACDIGANKGSYIYWLSWWVHDGRVVAFEPQPELARDLRNICDVIGLGNVTVEAKAVHLRAGKQQLYVPVGHQPSASLMRRGATDDVVELSVPVVALDSYFGENDKVTLLKIDVEGAELGLLRGAERILRRSAPLLVLECENRHLAPGTVGEVFSYLASLGYEGSFVWRNRVLPIAQFDAAVHQRQDGPWFWKSKDYCHNFVFRRAEGKSDAAPY